jgi:hypothetical protein
MKCVNLMMIYALMFSGLVSSQWFLRMLCYFMKCMKMVMIYALILFHSNFLWKFQNIIKIMISNISVVQRVIITHIIVINPSFKPIPPYSSCVWITLIFTITTAICSSIKIKGQAPTINAIICNHLHIMKIKTKSFLFHKNKEKLK